MSINDGGPAFPNGNYANWDHGMTLRDYFAAKAMQAILSNEFQYLEHKIDPSESGTIQDEYAAVVEEAYAIADAMLAAREKKTV